MKKNIWTKILLISFILLLIITIYGGILLKGDIKTFEESETNLSSTIANKEKIINEKLDEILTLEENNKNLQEEVSLKTENIETLTSDLLLKQNSNSLLLQETNDLTKEIEDLSDNITILESTVNCSSTLYDIDFSSQASVSQSLIKIVEEKYGTVDDAEWDILFNNTKTSIHTLTEEFTHKFFVYFDEPDFSYNEGVFVVSQACWLTLDEGN